MSLIEYHNDVVLCSSSDVFIPKLKYKFITTLNSSCGQPVPEDHHKPKGNSTVMKHIDRFRKMINLSLRIE